MTKITTKHMPRGYSDAIKSSFRGKDKLMTIASGDAAPLQSALTVLHKNSDVNTLAGVRAVCWTPDGRELASAGDAGPVHICDVRYVSCPPSALRLKSNLEKQHIISAHL